MKRSSSHLLGKLLIGCIILPFVACQNSSSTDNKRDNANEQSDIAVIKMMEKQRLAAGLKKDLAHYDSTTAADYLQIDFEGNLLDKPTMLERVKSTYAQLQSNETDEELIRLYGNVAILTARAHPRGTMKGKEFADDVRYTRIYVKRDGVWQVVLFQQTRVHSKN